MSTDTLFVYNSGNGPVQVQAPNFNSIGSQDSISINAGSGPVFPLTPATGQLDYDTLYLGIYQTQIGTWLYLLMEVNGSLYPNAPYGFGWAGAPLMGICAEGGSGGSTSNCISIGLTLAVNGNSPGGQDQWCCYLTQEIDSVPNIDWNQQVTVNVNVSAFDPTTNSPKPKGTIILIPQGIDTPGLPPNP